MSVTSAPQPSVATIGRAPNGATRQAGQALVADSLADAVREQEERLLNCVHCGFCLPACPTYRRLGDEADSPRGRLHLMRAVVEGRLEAGSDAFQVHIGRCLGCRACEPVCPSGVTYGHLLELARQTGSAARRRPLATRALLGAFGVRWLAAPVMAVARVLRATRLPALAARLLRGQPALACAMLAASAPPRFPGAGVFGSSAPDRLPDAKSPTVGILTGCVQSGLFARVNDATARVLRVNGYKVVRVRGQGCCGALHAHAGDLDSARAMARRNIKAFESAGVDYVAMNASGCGAATTDYAGLLAGDPAWADRAVALSRRVRDVSQLLVRKGPAQGAAVRMTVTYDAPCHLLHAQGVSEPPQTVLDAIPGLRQVPLPGSAECCGGAGIYGLTHPELGSWIGGDKVKSVQETGADALVTGNPGCMMQIGAGLLLAGSGVSAVHLVELLDESYRRAGRYGGPDR